MGTVAQSDPDSSSDDWFAQTDFVITFTIDIAEPVSLAFVVERVASPRTVGALLASTRDTCAATESERTCSGLFRLRRSQAIPFIHAHYTRLLVTPSYARAP